MSVNYSKTKTGSYKVSELQSEINVNTTIVPSCISISGTGTSLTLVFAASLSAGEETELDSVISSHVPSSDLIDAVQLPISLLGDKVCTHNSFKPVSDKTVYSVWTGAGDDIGGGNIGEGPILHFKSQVGSSSKIVDVEFLSDSGRVWIHEAYLKFEGAGEGDYMEGNVRAHPTPIQTSTDLDLILSNNIIKPALGGAGTGTHGFDGDPIPIPRTFSMDGDWDIVNGSLVPNYDGTGLYKLNQTERVVHRFVNRISCYGNSEYFSMTSNETIEVPNGFFIEVRQYNVSDTVWYADVMLEIYRERTHAQQ